MSVKDVKVFGMADCSGCTTVKNTLDAKGVAYSVVDIFENEELASQYRVRTLPTTVVVDKEGVEHIFPGATKQVIDSILLHAGV